MTDPDRGSVLAGTGSVDVLIVCSGLAAGELGFKLRQAGYAGRITLVGEERHLPYHRPPLSKGFLAGEVEEAALLLRPAALYDRAEIGFVGGVRVSAIDRAAKRVTLSDGGLMGYGSLVLATGGRARRLDLPGADLDGIATLRTLDDVTALRARLATGGRLILVGGGYVGLEVAAVARKRGLDVTLIESARRLLARVAGPEISRFYETLHRTAGVTLHLGAAVTGFQAAPDRPASVGAVLLGNGERVAADTVVAGVGLIPNVELAEECGLKVDNGIWVDEHCRTDDRSILAIGDCSNHPSLFYGRRIRLESVPNALEQVRVAAETLCGRLSAYAAIPWFWSDQYGVKLQAVGLADGHDQVVLRGLPAAGAFSAFYLRHGVVIAADCVDRIADFTQARKLVGGRLTVDAAALADETRPLKALLTA